MKKLNKEETFRFVPVDGKELGNKLRKLRTSARMEVRDLAKKLGVTEASVYAYENGLRVPRDGVKTNYCNLFNVPVMDLFFTDKSGRVTYTWHN